MSDRTGAPRVPLWWLRPIVDGRADDSRGAPFAGTLEEMVAEMNRRERASGLRHAAREIPGIE